MNRKQIVFLAFSLITNLCNTQQASQPFITPIKPHAQENKPYYTSSIFNSLENGNQHAPMLIIFDPIENEPAASTTPSLTFSLAMGMSNSSYPIIVSGYLLKNLLIRTRIYDAQNVHSNNTASKALKKIFEKIDFSSATWSLFDITESPLVLLVPRTISNLFAASDKKLGLKTLPLLDTLLPEKKEELLMAQSAPELSSWLEYSNLISWLEKNKSLKPLPILPNEFKNAFSTDITPYLEKIFDNNKIYSPFWDIFFEGHGFKDPAVIAGLTPEYFNKVLSFFDQKIKTNMLLVRSCSAGGQNKTLLETSQDGVQTNHNFPIIIASISDSIVVPSVYGREKMISDFFNNAGFTQDKGTSVNNLLRAIAEFNPSIFSYHGSTGFPQIWFPGGYGFQTPQIINHVLTVGNVFLKIHRENNEPIGGHDIILILIYPQLIDVILKVEPFNLKDNLTKQWNSFAFIFEKSFFSNSPPEMIKAVLDQLKLENLLPAYLSKLPEIAHEKTFENPNYYIYPEIISMNPQITIYNFSQIKVFTQLDGKQVATGVLQFIRDAFFDPSRETDHRYYIDTITGLNDISLTLAGSRILAQRSEKHPLEEILKDRINQEISLKNVIISPYHNHISFQIEGTTWQFGNTQMIKDANKQMRWNFKKIDSENYEKAYKATKEKIITDNLGQKSISAVLQEKQRQATFKKETEIKRKNAAESAVKKYQEAQKK